MANTNGNEKSGPPASSVHLLAAANARAAAEALGRESHANITMSVEQIAEEDSMAEAKWYELHVGNGRFLRVKGDFDLTTVTQLVRVLASSGPVGGRGADASELTAGDELDAAELAAAELVAAELDAGVLDADEVAAAELVAAELEAGELEAAEAVAANLVDDDDDDDVDADELGADELDAAELAAAELVAAELEAGVLDADEVAAAELVAAELEAGELEAAELEAAAFTDDDFDAAEPDP